LPARLLLIGVLVGFVEVTLGTVIGAYRQQAV
jgi:hypothetical protein